MSQKARKTAAYDGYLRSDWSRGGAETSDARKDVHGARTSRVNVVTPNGTAISSQTFTVN